MFLHELGTSVCHQSVTRSFAFAGEVLPVCSRCTGIYLGAFVAYLYFLFSSKRKASEIPPKKIILVLLSFILLMGIDVGTAILELRKSTNYIRLFTGLFTGGVLVSFLYPITNYMIWKKNNKTEIISDYRDLLKFLFYLLIFYFPIVSGITWFFWPVSIFSIAGILTLYLNVNLAVLIILFKKEQKVEKFKDLIIYIPGVILLASAELYLLRLYHIMLK